MRAAALIMLQETWQHLLRQAVCLLRTRPAIRTALQQALNTMRAKGMCLALQITRAYQPHLLTQQRVKLLPLTEQFHPLAVQAQPFNRAIGLGTMLHKYRQDLQPI